MNSLDGGDNEQLATYLIKIIRQTLPCILLHFMGKSWDPGDYGININTDEMMFSKQSEITKDKVWIEMTGTDVDSKEKWMIQSSK